MSWSPAEIDDLSGRTAVVTGPSVGGLGYYTALALAWHGARVVLAGRSPSKLEDAATALRGELSELSGAIAPGGLSCVELDLASFSSVRRAAQEIADLGPLDVLVNNAGVMGTPRASTGDGYDLQVQTNHLGPFLLTGLLLPSLVASGDGRVVAVSSIFHRFARRPPTVIGPRRGLHNKWRVYGESKLGNLLFVAELERRCREADLPVRALAAHPGFSGTHLAANGQYGRSSGGIASILDAAIRGVSQPASTGAWPTLMAATADLPGGTFCGPSGLGELGGSAQVVTGNYRSQDLGSARRLWEDSESATGLRYPA